MKECKCLFCDQEIMMKRLEPLFCKTCKIILTKCKKCGKLFNIKFKQCPHCGHVVGKKARRPSRN